MTFRVVIAFMHTERLILPSPVDLTFLNKVAKISQYLCINALT